MSRQGSSGTVISPAMEGRSACGAERHSAIRPIRLDHHTLGRRDRLDQLQVVRLTMLRKQPQPVADDDRIDPQVELVDEVALEQPAEQDAAAVKLELASRLRLQVADS